MVGSDVRGDGGEGEVGDEVGDSLISCVELVVS